MITVVRVDDRLLHGQVVYAWVPATDSDTLVVVADEERHDILQKEFSGFASESGLDVKVFDGRGACLFLRDPALDNHRVMVVLSSIAEAERIREEGFIFTNLNIGNIHHADYKTKLSPSAMITEAEERAMERLSSAGVTFDIRVLPDTKVM